MPIIDRLGNDLQELHCVHPKARIRNRSIWGDLELTPAQLRSLGLRGTIDFRNPINQLIDIKGRVHHAQMVKAVPAV